MVLLQYGVLRMQEVLSYYGTHWSSQIISTFVLLHLALLNPAGALAGAEEDERESASEAHSDSLQPIIPNENVLELGRVSGNTLMTQAELCLKSRNFDKAIQFARRSIQENGDDADLHRIYAEALEGKLQLEKEKDPTLYRECVEEWLSVMRSGNGEERGLNIQGAGGIADFLYKDDDHYILARHHLLELTGVLPKAWETNSRYMKRVLKPKPGVKGTLVDEKERQK
jgi:hypothetical protein